MSKFQATAKNLIVGVAMIGALTLLVHEIATSFNITGFTLVVVDLIPTFAGIGLLLLALDVI